MRVTTSNRVIHVAFVELYRIRSNSQLISWIIGLSLAVLAGDALYSRARLHLRSRATHHARRPAHSGGGEGWHEIGSIAGLTARAAEEYGQAEIVTDDNLSRFDSLLNNNHRRPRR
jgi:hypothetical protein